MSNNVLYTTAPPDIAALAKKDGGIRRGKYTFQQMLEFLQVRYNTDYIELELGCGKSKERQCAIGLNPLSDPLADIWHDLNVGIPLPDCSVDNLYSSQVLEHLRKENQILIWNEMWRVLKYGGTMEHFVPHYLSPSADGDPTHFTKYTETSFQYYCARPDGRPFVEEFSDYGIKSRFKIVKHEVKKFVDIHYVLEKPRVVVTDKRYATAQNHELQWWRDNKYDPHWEWEHYDKHFEQYCDKVFPFVVDVGCGPVPYFCNGKLLYEQACAIDPLIDEYLELEKYSVYREGFPFAAYADTSAIHDGTIAATFCLNTLDHVQDPLELLRELARITVYDGMLFLMVDVGKPADICHPHTLNADDIRSMLRTWFSPEAVYVEKSWKFESDVFWYIGYRL